MIAPAPVVPIARGRVWHEPTGLVIAMQTLPAARTTPPFRRLGWLGFVCDCVGEYLESRDGLGRVG